MALKQTADMLTLSPQEIDERYTYTGTDLGVTFTETTIRLRLWAPTAERVIVRLFRTLKARKVEEFEMRSSEQGTWVTEVDRIPYEGYFYTFQAMIGGAKVEAVDPYAKAVGTNGRRGALIDPSAINPDRWVMERPLFHSSQDAVIYELHVRDATSHPASGVKARGTFLGLTEAGTQTETGMPTGLDYLADLGVTHVQLLPIYDYATVNESNPGEESNYNWGYDPQNYFAPEGSYSSNPDDPSVRIRELKTLIQALHDRGIRVIMDVVFNHTFDAEKMPLGQFVPGYFYRQNADGTLSNGSFCGNDTASERAMMRKFIVDCTTYWAREYHLDGFRFDLMGVHDVETMNQVRSALDRVDPSILLIGEGWDMDTPLPLDEKANYHNATKMPRIAHFNNGIRDGIKGDVQEAEDRGYVGGAFERTSEVKRGIAGNVSSQGFADEPNQVVTYCEAHDDLTTWDKLAVTNPDDTEEMRKKRQMLATAIVLTSQGIPFLHAGQEFFRTKNGNRNTFNAGEAINRLDYERADENRGAVAYVKGLIALRRQYPMFRLENAALIKKHLRFLEEEEGVIAYELKRTYEGYIERQRVYHNATEEDITVTLPHGDFEALVEENVVKLHAPRLVEGRELTVPALSTTVIAERRPDYKKYAVAGGTAMAILGLLYAANKRRKNKK
ncbi:type I pullulanase [Exiguobacterium flavidum]|uniref:type I pullulanase n=1 Tax=Exiguobacterium flavidum TaxID=2184695 RepID=UPI000DF83903|nr:type I pullulanase [Exiguobacterium flavidum]